MKHYFIYIFLVSIVFISSCTKEKENEIIPVPVFTDFSFLKSHNNTLSVNVYMTIEGNKISGILPYNSEVESLAPTFYTNGATVSIDGYNQQSGINKNNFTDIVTYTLTSTDGTTAEYNVELSVEEPKILPKFYLFTDGAEPIDSKDDYRQGNFLFYGNNVFDDAEGDMKIRGRGNSTWMHPKKPYQMKLDEKAEIMGMPADKKWIFLAEYSDKTFLRNKIAFEMGYMSNLEWTPLSSFADVFVNDEYNGTYHISQKVEESINRVDLEDNGFLLEIDQFERLDPDDVFFYSSQFLINIKAPDLAYDGEKYNYITNFIDEFETALYGANFTNPNTGYEKYAEINSFVDWYLINEITKNVDSKDFSSIYLNLVVGEKLKMGPLWDFDLAFGNNNYSDCEYPEGFWVKDNPYINRMFDDPKFVRLVKERFDYYRSQESELYKIIDENASLLNLSVHANDEKWNLLGEWVWPNAVVFDTYVEEVNYLKEWLGLRMNWLDSEFSKM